MKTHGQSICMKFQFVTAGAGFGKTYTLKEMVTNCTERYVVVAPTGIAALNANGCTIHSAFKINPDTGFVNPNIKYGPLRGIKTIFIDEVSMVSSELMASVFTAAEMLGVETIVSFGDLAQLKPVKGSWFFEFSEPDEITRLTKCYRQGEDGEFAGILNRIRNRQHSLSDIAYLNKYKGDSGEGVTLAFSNATVDTINRQGLASIDSPMIDNQADTFGNISSRDVPAPDLLQMKVGARVVMLVNDREGRFRNGTRGEIAEIGDTAVSVRIDGVSHLVEEHTWTKKVPQTLTREREEYWENALGSFEEVERELAKHTLRNGYEMATVGSFTQFPFKLGYASTVHKSQGLTLDKVIIRPDGFDTQHGLGYVALSRLTSLAGLTTYRNLRREDFITNPKVLPYL